MAILLRTLTEKSVMQEGKYAGNTVQHVIDLGHTAYLRWVYYNMSMISFSQDILRKIYINEKDEIKKPGKCPEKVMEKEISIKRCLLAKGEFGAYKHIEKVINTEKKRKYMQNVKLSAKLNSKGNLQRMNHGHN